MRQSMYQSTQALCLLMILALSGSAQATGSDMSFHRSKSSNASTEPDRIRFSLELAQIESIPVRRADGTKNRQDLVTNKMKHTLRARLDRVNHFYVGAYHVATEPLTKVDPEKPFQLRIRIAKQIGTSPGVEETIGHFIASGSVHRDGEAYAFKSRTMQQFRSDMAKQRLLVTVNAPRSSGTPVATGTRQGKKKSERAL